MATGMATRKGRLNSDRIGLGLPKFRGLDFILQIIGPRVTKETTILT